MNAILRKAKPQHVYHIENVEHARNQAIPTVRKQLVEAVQPVYRAIKDSKEPAAVAAHATQVLRGQKESLSLAVAHAYETVAAPFGDRALVQIGTSLPHHPPEKTANYKALFGKHVEEYVGNMLPGYMDKVVHSFARQADDIRAKHAKASVAVPVLSPEPLGETPRRSTTYRASSYKANAPRKPAPATAPNSMPAEATDTPEVSDDESDDLTPADTFSDVSGLVDTMLDIMAEMIVVTACNLGMDAAANSFSDDSGIDLVKIWQALEDNRTRASHADADGQEQDLGDPFDVGDSQLLFPLDESLGADIGEIIYCRCVVVFEPASTMAARQARQWGERMLRIVHDHYVGGTR